MGEGGGGGSCGLSLTNTQPPSGGTLSFPHPSKTHTTTP
jgi:hypothetical protein